MNRLQRACVPPSEVDRIINDYVKAWKNDDAGMRKAFPAESLEEARNKIGAHVMFRSMNPVYRNDTYQVVVSEISCEWGPMVHLSIKRNDREPIHDWRDLQEIKNQLCGDECEAIELYPAESRRVDTANQYHLWVIKEAGCRFPFGFEDRLVTEDSIANSKQRPL